MELQFKLFDYAFDVFSRNRRTKTLLYSGDNMAEEVGFNYLVLTAHSHRAACRSSRQEMKVKSSGSTFQILQFFSRVINNWLGFSVVALTVTCRCLSCPFHILVSRGAHLRVIYKMHARKSTPIQMQRHAGTSSAELSAAYDQLSCIRDCASLFCTRNFIEAYVQGIITSCQLSLVKG